MNSELFTMSQISRKLNVSKSSVYRSISKLNLRETSTRGKAKLYNQEAFQKIQKDLSDLNNKQFVDNSKNNSELIQELKTEVERWKNETDKRNEQIDKLTQLLDQSQRLQLDVQNKLKKLESNTTQSRENDSKNDKKNTSEQNKKPSNKTRESFWKRLFR
ncbi:replication protein B [Lentilactobacillus hilgardii]|uniref:replication protein B n=1 Tax=Lentilactobacillus hilgardii TaxID=1588 RepID=UPI0021A86E7F|nr:replication protein B [Lentilactobacillus hilgardii]MCT3399385.1 replication protein B [Lentilactobacillus hilgardii]